MGRKSKVVLLPTVWVLDLACLGLLWKKLRPYSLAENSLLFVERTAGKLRNLPGLT